MHFCTKCDNMYYIKINDDDENQLIYYCRKCGHEDSEIIASLDNVCVSKTDKKGDRSYGHVVNRYTKLDPTLPRLYNIKCPNDACMSNRKHEEKGEDVEITPEIIYLRYDDINMKFVYICVSCDTVWKSNNN